MKARLQHAVFAAILLGTLVTKEITRDVFAEVESIESVIIRTAKSQGLVFWGYSKVTYADFQALKFEAPGCAQSVSVAVLTVALEQEPLVRSGPEEGKVRHYVYIDRTWNAPNRLAIFFARISHAALAAFGLSRYVPSWHLLLVDAPLGCSVVDSVDWRLVWDRDYQAAAENKIPQKSD
jgi:hypothetical protein